MSAIERILVIRLSALGDIVLCFRSFAAIRKAHPKARLALLTSPALAGFARQMPWFDEVLTDPRPSFRDVRGWAALIRSVRSFTPTRVYDLQGKFRQTILFAALGGPLGVEWSGAAPLCSFSRLWPPEQGMHFTDFIAAQLARAGVSVESSVDLSWLDAPIEKFGLSERTVLFIPGCAPSRLYKRWPAANYAAVAGVLHERDYGIAAIGTAAEAETIAEIVRYAPFVRDLSGQTSLFDVAALARRSVFVLGNDTGPIHIAAAVGAPTITLMADSVNPDWSAPKEPKAFCLQGHPLSALSVEKVMGFIDQERIA